MKGQEWNLPETERRKYFTAREVAELIGSSKREVSNTAERHKISHFVRREPVGNYSPCVSLYSEGAVGKIEDLMSAFAKRTRLTQDETTIKGAMATLGISSVGKFERMVKEYKIPCRKAFIEIEKGSQTRCKVRIFKYSDLEKVAVQRLDEEPEREGKKMDIGSKSAELLKAAENCSLTLTKEVLDRAEVVFANVAEMLQDRKAAAKYLNTPLDILSKIDEGIVVLEQQAARNRGHRRLLEERVKTDHNGKIIEEIKKLIEKII